MIRRYPPRSPRGPYQDFHFFAAPDPLAAGISSAFQGAKDQVPAANTESHLPGPLAAEPEPPRPPQITSKAADVPEPSQPIDAAPIPQLPAAPPREIVQLIGPRERAAAAAAAASAAAARTTPASKPQPKPRPRKRATARLATPRQNRPAPAHPPSASSDGPYEHERRCSICRHRDRDSIENEFMHWHSLEDISDEYNVSRAAIYRHAYALNLFARRNRNLRFALGHLIERVQDVEPTADSVVRAIHAFARINDDGEWIEPPAHVIVSSGGIHREAAAGGARRPIAIPLDSQTMSNVIDVTPEPTPEPALPDLPAPPPQRGVVVPDTLSRVESDATC